MGCIKIKQQMQRVASLISIGIFTFTFAYMLSVAAATPNPHCPASLMAVNECPFALSAQIDEIQNTFLSIVPAQNLFSIFIAFFATSPFFFFITFAYLLFLSIVFYIHSHPPDAKIFSWISLLFKRGILNPKLFLHA